MNEGIFREYDIRGIAERDLPSELVTDLGKALGSFLKRKGGRRLSLGWDCRQSSSRLQKALVVGLKSTGMKVLKIGVVPTPLLYFSVFEKSLDGGVMITGSHNPGDYNGFKMCEGKNSVYGDDIQLLKKMIVEKDFDSGEGSEEDFPLNDLYMESIVKGINKPLNIKVVLDSGNGMAGPFAPRVLEKLGCEVISLYSDPDGSFPNHHPDPTVTENLSDLRSEVEKSGAQLGIAFDGDADRIGVVDKTGRVIFGDELLILYARDVLAKKPGAKIISEVKASHRFFNDVRAHGGDPIMWKTGHSLIKTKMKEVDSPLAGEMSGHMFFKDRYYGFDDAIYAAARIAEIVARENKTPAELLADLPDSFATPEIRVDCPDEIKFDVVEKARKYFVSQGLEVNPIDGARVEFNDGWGLVRASNTQPVLVYRFEAQSKTRLDEIRQTLEKGVAQFLP